MLTSIDRLIESGCAVENKEKICRSRGGESCAFDGAMIVLQPIADTAHIVHGPIACAGNSWEGRGTLSSKGDLHRMGFTTDMSEMDVIYGSEEKLYNAIIQTYLSVRPKAIFVYSTCVSGLIGEDTAAVCKRAETFLNHQGCHDGNSVGTDLQCVIARSEAQPSDVAIPDMKIRVIPVNSPGFVGPKNLGNRIAGEVLLDHVIGTGEPSYTTDYDINLIGEYNIAGDLWLVEPLLRDAGIRVLSRITGDSSFEEITYAHRAKLNVVVCSRALINIAREMERIYGIPYVEVSFFGKTEMAKAIRAIAGKLQGPGAGVQGQESSPHLFREGVEQGGDRITLPGLVEKVERVIQKEEQKLAERLEAYVHFKGKRAVLYTGGVKSWSLISALRDLGIDIVAVGTKKSTFEDEEKIKVLLGENAPLVEDVAAKNLLRLMEEGRADILIAGGRNQYLAMKEGFPFVDVNQERHVPYAGYEGLLNLAEQISNSIEFFSRQAAESHQPSAISYQQKEGIRECVIGSVKADKDVLINPLKHSPAIGAVMAFQGVHSALPIIHGAQGCGFLGKVLLTKHFREPIALASTKLFTEDVVMGSDETLIKVVEGFVEKNDPDVVGILSSGLSQVKGDDVAGTLRTLGDRSSQAAFVHVPTPDYDGGIEAGYAKAVEGILGIAENALFTVDGQSAEQQVNVLVGSHLSPADFTELRGIVESFGLRSIILPDLSALDGSRRGFSALAVGGTRIDEIKTMRLSTFTIAIGASMEAPARILKERFGIEYRIFESISGLQDVDAFINTLSTISKRPIPHRYERQRRILVDGMRDAHFYYGNKRVGLALEPDLSIQMSRWLYEMGADVALAVIPTSPASAGKILSREVVVGDLFSIEGGIDILVSNSHGEDTAKKLGVPLYQIGFPVYKVLGNTSRVTIGYRGTLAMINEIANMLLRG